MAYGDQYINGQLTAAQLAALQGGGQVDLGGGWYAGGGGNLATGSRYYDDSGWHDPVVDPNAAKGLSIYSNDPAMNKQGGYYYNGALNADGSYGSVRENVQNDSLGSFFSGVLKDGAPAFALAALPFVPMAFAGAAAAGGAAEGAGAMSGMDLAADGALSGGNAIAGTYGAGAAGSAAGGGLLSGAGDTAATTAGDAAATTAGDSAATAGQTLSKATLDGTNVFGANSAANALDISALSAAAPGAASAAAVSQLASSLGYTGAATGAANFLKSLGIPGSAASLIAPLLGAAAGSQGVQSNTSQTKDIPDWLKPYVLGSNGQGGLLNYTNQLLTQQMQPGAMAGYDDMRTQGMGLLNGSIKFGRGDGASAGAGGATMAMGGMGAGAGLLGGGGLGTHMAGPATGGFAGFGNAAPDPGPYGSEAGGITGRAPTAQELALYAGMPGLGQGTAPAAALNVNNLGAAGRFFTGPGYRVEQ